MADKTYDAPFLCTGDSARSAIAEALRTGLRDIGPAAGDAPVP
jgi:hypothetical protein